MQAALLSWPALTLQAVSDLCVFTQSHDHQSPITAFLTKHVQWSSSKAL